jgi:hypothetical protein
MFLPTPALALLGALPKRGYTNNSPLERVKDFVLRESWGV